MAPYRARSSKHCSRITVCPLCLCDRQEGSCKSNCRTRRSDRKDPAKVIAEPGGLLLGPLGWERVGDVSNVVFSNGAIVKENGEILLYYAGSDTRVYVAKTGVAQLSDYIFNTPPDPGRSVLCVRKRCELIDRNLEILEREKNAAHGNKES